MLGKSRPKGGSKMASRETGCFRIVWLMIVLIQACAFGELRHVEVGGSIEMFAGWFSEFYEANEDGFLVIPPMYLPFRSIGPDDTVTYVRADGHGNSLGFVEQRTRLHVNASFSENVSAFIEFDSIDEWGEDFRSQYVTGVDAPSPTDDDVEVYQAYIDVQGLFGSRLSLRCGRQELSFGSGWLVGSNPVPNPFTGLSFDAIRVTSEWGTLSVDAWFSKLAERSPLEEDGDVDFYGIYATYSGLDDIEIDAYWLLVRDAVSITDTAFSPAREWLEDLLELDDYDVTNLHTVGIRATGAIKAWDWEVELAYQFGEADAVGALFVPDIYGDDDASWDNWAGMAEIGYTFDTAWAPRVYLRGEYYEGEDKRDMTFAQWLVSLDPARASVSFNRLFSDNEVDDFLDASGLTNFWLARTGFSATPSDAVELGVDVVYLQVVDPFDLPIYLDAGSFRIPVAPRFSFLDTQGAKDLGWQVRLWAFYEFTEDFTVEAGWTHYFVGEAISDGAFIDDNGQTFVGGRGDEDADFVYVFSRLTF